MESYYVNMNAQFNGDHEVHKINCAYGANETNRDYLGNFYDCSDAVRTAIAKGYSKVNGCAYCCLKCHTS